MTAVRTESTPLPFNKLVLPLLGVWIVWGAMYLFTRIGLTGLPPYALVAVRFLIAGSLLLLISRARGEPWPAWPQLRNSALIGMLLIGFGTSSTVFAQRWNTSGVASIIAATGSIWIALFSGFIGRWPTKIEWIGIAIGCAGVLVLSVGGIGGTSLTVQGLLIGMFGTISWSIGSVASQRVSMPQGMMRIAVQMLAGGVTVTIVSAVLREPVSFFNLQPQVLLACGGLVLGAIAGYGSYMFLLGHRKVSLASSYAYVNPVIAILLGALVLHEHVEPSELLGIAVILAGVVFVWLGSVRGR